MGGAVGRYQIVMNPNVRADTFLLDTATRVVWHLTRFNDVKGEPTVWMVMERLDSDTEVLPWAQRYGWKTPEPTEFPREWLQRFKLE